MKLMMISLFCEPGCHFDVSHKVKKMVEDLMQTDVINKYRFDNIKSGFSICLIVSTNSNTQAIEIKGPDIDKRNKSYTWGVWLPYKEIAGCEDQLPPYLKYLFDALVMFFVEQYGVKEEDIRNIQHRVEKEVINNPEYVFNEIRLPPIDVSKLNLEL